MFSIFQEQTLRKIILSNLFVGFSYIIAAWLSYLFVFESVNFPVFWFPMAIIFSSVLIVGLHIIPSIFISSFFVYLFVHLQTQDTVAGSVFLSSIGLATIETIVAIMMGYLIDRFDIKLSFLNETKTSFRFFLVSLLGSLPLFIFYFFPGTFILQNQNIFTFWLGNFSALLMGSVFIVAIHLQESPT